MKLTKDLIKRALCSGKYGQHYGALRRCDGVYCAIGALATEAEISVRGQSTSHIAWILEMNTPISDEAYNFLIAKEVIQPSQVNPDKISRQTIQSWIVHLNDGRRWTFNQIAEFLEYCVGE